MRSPTLGPTSREREVTLLAYPTLRLTELTIGYSDHT